MNMNVLWKWNPYLLILSMFFFGLLLWRPGTQVLCLGVLPRVAEPRDGQEAALGIAEPPEGVEAAEDVGHLLLPLTLRPTALPALGQLRSDFETRGVLEKEIGESSLSCRKKLILIDFDFPVGWWAGQQNCTAFIQPRPDMLQGIILIITI